MGYIIKDISIPIFEGIFILYLADDFAEIADDELIRQISIHPDDLATTTGLIDADGHIRGYVMVFHSKTSIGFIAHEATHLADLFLGNIGIPRGKDTSEVYAYFTGWCSNVIWDEIDKFNKGENGKEEKRVDRFRGIENSGKSCHVVGFGGSTRAIGFGRQGVE